MGKCEWFGDEARIGLRSIIADFLAAGFVVKDWIAVATHDRIWHERGLPPTLVE